MDDELFNRKPSQGSEMEGMESVVATVSGYHGSERFNLIRLIAQTGANYVGAMSKSNTHLVCWRFEGKKFSLAKKFKTLIVSHEWFLECAKAGKRVPEGPFIMKCGEEVGPVHVDGLLIEKENLQTGRQSNISADETTRQDNSATSTNYLHESNTRKTSTSLSFFLEQDTNPRTSFRLMSPKLLNKEKWKENQVGSKYHSKEKRISAIVEDEGHASIPLCGQSHKRKRDTFHDTFSSTSAEISSKGRRLLKKNATRTILESDISDSNQDCYAVGASGHELGMEQYIDVSVSLSPKKFNLRNDSATGVTHCEGSLNGCQMEDQNLSDQTTRQPISSEPSCAICWTDFSLTRGILPCGHRYCYQCIQNWSDQQVSKRKISTCPLCKEKFYSILKVDEAAASDQKVYSQTIPCAPLAENVSILADHGYRTQIRSSLACLMCHSCEPIESLESCNVCHLQYIHLYCLDPPLLPWVCVGCRDLRNLFHRS